MKDEKETTTQTVYKADVERVLARYGKPFAAAIGKMLASIEQTEQAHFASRLLTIEEHAESDR